MAEFDGDGGVAYRSPLALTLVETIPIKPAPRRSKVRTRLYDLRRARGWSQLELSERSGVSLSTIARYESPGGAELARNVRALVALARALELPLESVFPEALEVRRRRRRSA